MRENKIKKLEELAELNEKYIEAKKFIVDKRKYFEVRGSTEVKPSFSAYCTFVFLISLLFLLPAVIAFADGAAGDDSALLIAAGIFLVVYVICLVWLTVRLVHKRKLWDKINENFTAEAKRARIKEETLSAQIRGFAGFVPDEWLFNVAPLLVRIRSGVADSVEDAVKLEELSAGVRDTGVTVVMKNSRTDTVLCSYCGTYCSLSKGICPRCGAALKP